jgi:predicted site-specific integrase-resolvase
MRSNGSEWIGVSAAMERTGLSQCFLYKLADEGEVECYRLGRGVGHRRFNVPSLEAYIKSGRVAPAKQEEPSEGIKRNYIYTRVSSKKQEDDLKRQVECLKGEWGLKCPNVPYDLLSDISSGINFKRKGLSTLLDSCFQQSIGTVMVAHKDRLSRWGFDLLKLVIERNGGKLIVVDDDNHGKSTEQELAEDLLPIVHIYSCRNMGRRKYAKREATKISKTETETESSSEEEA